MPEVSGLIYACNDRSTIRAAVEDLSAALAPRTAAREIIVADDASTDGTVETVEEMRKERPELSLVRQGEEGTVIRPGYGAATRRGLAAARYDWVFQVDARNRLDLDAIDAFLNERGTCQVVVGRRRRITASFSRHVQYWLFRLFCRVVFGLPVSDVNCRMKLYRRDIFERIRIQSDRCFADAEILAKAGFYGLMIGEVPVATRPDAGPMRDFRKGYARRTLSEAWAVLRTPEFVLPDLPERPETDAPNAS